MQLISPLLDKVKQALSKTLDGKKIDAIDESIRLKEDLGLDSMSLIMFLIYLEENIDGFIVEPTTIKNKDMTSIGTITKYIERQLMHHQQIKRGIYHESYRCNQ
jgi:acyl carrier protein